MVFSRILILAFAFSVVLMPDASFAQRGASSTKLPDISVPPIGSEADRQGRLNPNNFSEFEIQNDYLGDKIKLQYQIALLERLIAFQRQVNNVKEAYEELGIEYQGGQPSRSICAQIPVNLPCYKSYPELYPAVEIKLSERQQHISEKALAEAEEKKGAASLLEAARPQGSPFDKVLEEQAEEKKAKKKKESIGPSTDFEWVEVFCLSGNCQTLLTNKRDNEVKITASVGDVLSDGTKISKILPGRVEAMKDGNLMIVKPAPLDGSSRRIEEEKDIPDGPLGNIFNNLAARNAPAAPDDGRGSTSLDDLPPLPFESETGLY